MFGPTVGRLLAAVVPALVIAIDLIATPSRVDAFSNVSPPFTGVSDFVTDFPSGGIGPLGPVGMLFAGGSFFATDITVGTIYRFPASGGSALRPQQQAANGLGAGLAVQQNVYYAINPYPGTSGLYRFDPTTLAATFVVDNIPGALRAVVADPLSGDLYISSSGGIFRVQNPASSNPSVTAFVNHGDYDGLTFTADGTRLYAANVGTESAEGYDRSGTRVFNVFVGHGLDGIAVALPDAVINGVNVSNNVFVNANDGTIERIDTNNGNAVSTVAAGGTRGDFVTVGPDGCLYVTQSDRIQKLSPCFFQGPPAPTCTLTAGGTNGQGQQFIQITVQDSTSGLQSVVVTQNTNATVSVPTFTPGTTSPVVVTATKTDQSQSAEVALQVTNLAGGVTNCDPILTEVGRKPGLPHQETFQHVARGEGQVWISNGTPGLTSLRLTVGGRSVTVTDLKDGEQRVVDVSGLLKRGTNTVTLTAVGKSRGSATVVIADK
jgi:hypothetical protein